MEKMISKMKKNNKGVSLVEVLVTIAMVVIIAGPLINSFLNSRLVNSNARLIQNGTTVAQDTAEQFKAKSLDELCEIYPNYVYEATTGIYTFKDIPVQGPDNESFLVDVKLDPSAYTSGSGSTDDKVQLNNVSLPGLSSIYGSDAIKLYKYYVAADQNLKELFSGKIGNTQLTNLYGAERHNLSKSTDIDINCRYNRNTERYEYDITMTMTYTYGNASGISVVSNYGRRNVIDWVGAPPGGPGGGPGGRPVVQHVERIEGVSFSEQQTHNIYLVCPVFDICSVDSSTSISNNMYASDTINITYNFVNPEEGTQPLLYFYLAEQDTAHMNDETVKMRLNPANIKVNAADLNGYNASTSKIKLCTNMLSYNVNEVPKLTYSDKVSGTSFYEMSVEVTLYDSDKVIAEFISTK